MLKQLKPLLNKLQSMLTERNLTLLMIVAIVIQPIIDIDYIFYPFLNQFGIPLPSTIIYFIGLPMLFFLTLYLKESNKARVLKIAGGYTILVLAYLFIHDWFVKDMFELLYLTNRYTYSLVTEFRYVLTLIIPFGLIYAFFKSSFDQKLFDKLVIALSILIAFPLFFSNLFLFGPSTYYDGPVMANFPTWFMGIYDTHHPKFVTTKFFFSQGNTTGILLFALYPLLIRQIFTSSKKWLIYVLIVIHGWAMYVLATRVATYGVPLMIGFVILTYLFLVIIRKEKFLLKPFATLVITFALFLSVLPVTPAVVNLGIDNRNDMAVFNDEYLRLQFKDEIGTTELIPGTAEFNYFYQHIFEQYYWLLTIPDVYYKWYYPYVIDPKFYVDLIFEVEFFDRQSGRQFQRIFFDYKWDKLDDVQKAFGFGYSRFMNGSILIEQDFVMQYYTLGPIGLVILLFPWLGMVLYALYEGLRQFKKIFSFDFILNAGAIGAILGGAYMSGHVLDEFFSTTILAFLFAMLFNRLKQFKVS